MSNLSITAFAAGALLTAFPLLGLAQAPTITTFSPARNARSVPRGSSVALTFSQALSNATAVNTRIFSTLSGGRKAVVATGSGNTLTADPIRDFRPGEVVSVSVPATVTSAGGVTAVPTVYQFTAAAGVGAATFTAGSDVAVSTFGAGNSALADVDGDGDLDLLAPNATRPVSLNDGRGNFSPTTIATIGSVAYFTMGDIDGDGDLDLLHTSSAGTGAVFIRLNNGSGTFAAGPVLSFSNNYATGVATADIDADGDLDILCASGNPFPGPGSPYVTTVAIFINTGTGSFAPSYTAGVGSNPVDMVMADVNSDGSLDLLASTSAGVSVRFNDGTGHFNGTQDLAAGNRPAVADVDGDGDLDLLTVNNSAGTASINLNNGQGVFGANVDVPVGFGPLRLAATDVDGDGDLDLVTANNDGNGGYSLSIRLNNGSGTFSGGSDPALPSEAASLATGDVDADGDIDLLLSSQNAPALRVQLNGTTGTQLATTAARSTTATLCPNPAHGWVTVAELASGPLLLFDALGREARRYPAPTATEAVLDLRGLPAGMYVLRSGTASQRLVVE